MNAIRFYFMLHYDILLSLIKVCSIHVAGTLVLRRARRWHYLQYMTYI